MAIGLLKRSFTAAELAAEAERAAERAKWFRQVTETLRGGAEVTENLADKAEAYAARCEGSALTGWRNGAVR